MPVVQFGFAAVIVSLIQHSDNYGNVEIVTVIFFRSISKVFMQYIQSLYGLYIFSVDQTDVRLNTSVCNVFESVNRIH